MVTVCWNSKLCSLGLYSVYTCCIWHTLQLLAKLPRFLFLWFAMRHTYCTIQTESIKIVISLFWLCTPAYLIWHEAVTLRWKWWLLALIWGHSHPYLATSLGLVTHFYTFYPNFRAVEQDNDPQYSDKDTMEILSARVHQSDGPSKMYDCKVCTCRPQHVYVCRHPVSMSMSVYLVYLALQSPDLNPTDDVFRCWRPDWTQRASMRRGWLWYRSDRLRMSVER